jgi:hypothetical protein
LLKGKTIMTSWATYFMRTCLLACSVLAHGHAAAADPVSVVFARDYSASETDKLYRGYLQHLAQCTGSNLTNHFGQPLFGRLYSAETVPESQIPLLFQSGRLQVAVVSAALAVWMDTRAIAEPIALRGQAATKEPENFSFLMLVRSDSPIKTIKDISGIKVGFPFGQKSDGTDAKEHADLDARFAENALSRIGLSRGKEYQAGHANGHEQAVVGLQNGFWQAALIASDQFDRMVKKREARARDFREIWRSVPLPSATLVVAKALPVDIKARLSQCTLTHRFTDEQTRLFEGSDTFLRVNSDFFKPYHASSLTSK